MLTEVMIEDDRWAGLGLPALAEGAARAVLEHLDLDPDNWEIALLACDDTRIAVLNAGFRGAERPTNVLSWPEVARAPDRPGARPPAPAPDPSAVPAHLGDIALAYDTCAREAAAQGKSLTDHTAHLVVHAALHLLGYDHIRDEDATLMESTEIAILGKLGISDPY